jgi:hypothetical protein
MAIWPELEDIYLLFPKLRDEEHAVTSPASASCNCVSWVMQDTSRVWWPSRLLRFYWPPGVRREETVSAFEEAFAASGYTPCATGDAEDGVEKVALYVDPASGKPAHAARQIASGAYRGHWSSKLGSEVDIRRRTTSALEGQQYGVVYRYYSRPLRNQTEAS